MEHYNLIKPEDLGKGSSIKLDVSTAEVDIYWKVAMEVLAVIEENNKKGEPTVMVVPYGPLGPYFRLAYLVNKHRISLKNCVFINISLESFYDFLISSFVLRLIYHKCFVV